MKKTGTILWIGIRQMISDPIYLLFAMVLPLLITWIMSFLPEGDVNYETAILGVLVMFVGLNILTSAGGYILDEKQCGTWNRILASPTSYWQIIIGYFIKLFLLAWTQTGILILSSRYLFGAPWDQGMLTLLGVLTLYIFLMTSLGMFIAGFLKSSGQVQAVSMAFIMAGTMLGGVFFKIEASSWVIRLFEQISPQRWVAISLGMIQGDVTSYGYLIMFCVGLLFLSAGIWKLKIQH